MWWRSERRPRQEAQTPGGRPTRRVSLSAAQRCCEEPQGQRHREGRFSPCIGLASGSVLSSAEPSRHAEHRPSTGVLLDEALGWLCSAPRFSVSAGDQGVVLSWQWQRERTSGSPLYIFKSLRVPGRGNPTVQRNSHGEESQRNRSLHGDGIK